jgi:hypothetical protein
MCDLKQQGGKNKVGIQIKATLTISGCSHKTSPRGRTRLTEHLTDGCVFAQDSAK